MSIQPDSRAIDRLIGAQVRQLRRARGLTQLELAKRLELSFQQVQKYETGANRISCATLAIMAKILDAPIAAFFEGLPEPSNRSAPLASPKNRKTPTRGADCAAIMAGLERLSHAERRGVLALVRALADRQGRSGPVEFE